MKLRLARIPRLAKLRDWRRNRWGGARWDRSDPRFPEPNAVGRPWEGRGKDEALRQRGEHDGA